MTAAPIARPTTAPVAAQPSARLTDAEALRSFVSASRTAVRFVRLPADDRARVLADLDLLEAESSRAVVRPALVAGLRFAVETTLERAVRGRSATA